MPFCPDCRAEYKSEVEKCSDCGVKLVDDLKNEGGWEKSDYVALRSLPSRMYAEMLQEALKNEGIPSIIRSDDIAVTFGSYGTTSAVPVMIWVLKEDAKKCDDIANQMLDHI